MHRLRWIILSAAVLFAPLAMSVAQVQEPTPPPASGAPETRAAAPSSSTPGKTKYSHTNDFLVRGTVFNDKALSFSGVEVRIRVASQKKYRWESYTNSRGEFAVRVPQGAEYEMLVHAKGFADQTRTIDAKSGGNEETVVFRMQPIVGGKK